MQTQTNSFGYYQFENLATGVAYVITVSAKSCQFVPQIIWTNSDLINLDFTASS